MFNKPSLASPWIQVLILTAIAACLFFARLGRLPLLEPDEGRNAEVAREMLTSGDWITPHFDTLPYLDKPVLYFWFVAGSFHAFGLSEWAARLPSALAALGTLLLTWFLARRMFGGSTGLAAGVVFSTVPLAIAFSRTVIFDMTLTFFVTLAIAAFWLGEGSGFRETRWDVVAFGSMGLATLTKGPVGFLVPLLSLLAYAGLRGRIGELKRIRWGLGLAVFLAVVLPWFIAVSARNPGFPKYALWQESLLRFATHRAHRGGSIFYYIPVYLAGFFPWSFFLLFALWNRRGAWRRLRGDRYRAVAFLLAWPAVIFVFFSISRSKLPAYFLPALVPLSVLMAKAWDALRGSSESSRRPDWLTGGFAALILVGLLIAFAPHLIEFLGLRTRVVRRVHPAVRAMLGPSLTYTGIALAALGFLGRNLVTRARFRATPLAAFVLVALTVPLLLLRWIQPLATYASTASSRSLARNILEGPERDRPVYGYYYFRTSLPFYLRRPVGLVTADGDEITSNYVVARFAGLRGKPLNPGAPEPLLAGPDEFERFAGHPRPTLVMVRNEFVPQLAAQVGRLESLWEGWQYSVWEIPAQTSGRAGPEAAKSQPVR